MLAISGVLNFSKSLSSSSNFTATNLLWVAIFSRYSSIFCMLFSMFESYISFFSTWKFSSIALINSFIPVSFNADICTTFVPNSLLSFSTLIFNPFLDNISAMLSATITLQSSSNNCVVKYKLLSSEVLSTMFIITSGFSSNTKFLETSSSVVYGLKE